VPVLENHRLWQKTGKGYPPGRRILDADIFKEIVGDLDDEERSVLHWVLDGGGFRPWGEFTERFGDDMDESPYWQWHEPESLPGRLKRTGLLYVGMLNELQVAFIPADIREQLAEILSG